MAGRMPDEKKMRLPSYMTKNRVYKTFVHLLDTKVNIVRQGTGAMSTKCITASQLNLFLCYNMWGGYWEAQNTGTENVMHPFNIKHKIICSKATNREKR